MPPCFDFTKHGRCRYGAKCRFSHEGGTVPSQAKTQKPRNETTTEKSFREWTYMIPKSSSMLYRPVDMKAFFQGGYKLIEAEDAGTRQLVITKLGEEIGLQMVRGLTDQIEQTQGASGILTFKDITLPFFRTISNSAVLSSLLLENQVAAIYTFLFGPSGTRGLSLFRQTADALRGLIQGQPPNDHEICFIAVSSTLAVLDKLIEINQSAQVVEGFAALVEAISASVPEHLMVVNAQQSLTRMRRRLQIGSSLPLASTEPPAQNNPAPIFELPHDQPGTLSPNGARHDNDHTNIGKIKILPTALEIASVRQEYLPFIDSTQQHLSGLRGLLDRQFRLLREDTVGQLRDAVREEVFRLGQAVYKTSESSRRQGVRKLIYHNIRFTSLRLDRRKGFQITAEFDQPAQVKNKSTKNREEWWETSKLLQIDALVCFVSADGTVIFFSVCDPALSRGRDDFKSGHHDERLGLGDTTSLFHNADLASVTLSLAEYKEDDVFWITQCLGARSTIRQSLVEFPGVLLPSFQPTLQALQKMSKSLNLPFAEIIAPELNNATAISPPAYATRGFSFNLDDLAGVPLTLTPGKAFDFAALQKSSCTLDDTQQNAVVQALSTELALIQGPPGTGKSYTGVSIIKTLLHNRRAAKLGPIICVCYTNHALDQLLEHLVNDGVKQIIRLGSRSKSEILQSLTINSVRKNVLPSKLEKSTIWTQHQSIEEIVKEVEELLPSLNNPSSWVNIRDYLQETHNRHFKQLFGRGVDDEGFREVKGRKFRAVEAWLRNAPKNIATNRPVGQLHALPLNDLSKQERQNLHSYWIEQYTARLTTKLIHAMGSYHALKTELDTCHRELDLRCLQEAHIIGVTTSGLARNLDLLQRVRAKVMLCEEAGEVLEAHTLTALLPGIEHAILIGDHEQLRPQINNYELQHDNPRVKIILWTSHSLNVLSDHRVEHPRSH